MPLSAKRRRYLRGLTHDLSPVVIIAARGLDESHLAEIDAALKRHELIKVRLRADRRQRGELTESIVDHCGAELIHAIGQVACFYRPNPDTPRIVLPEP